MDRKKLQEELLADSDWELQPQFSGIRVPKDLLHREFLGQSQQLARWQTALTKVCNHAFECVPYYRESIHQPKSVGAGTIEQKSWLQLPLLTKKDLISSATALRATRLSGNQLAQGASKTSGTTGQPVEVLQSNTSRSMFAWLKQRELRWFRFKPRGTHLSIRPGEELGWTRDGNKWPDGQVLKMAGWPYLEKLFLTGPAFGYASTNPVLDQLAVVEDIQPDYLLIESGTLENLALQDISDETISALKGVQCISQTLTAEMRRVIGSGLRTEVHQNYGLNEIGLVASMCPEGQRYHVHHEHCFVEILNESGEPAKPGERGKIVVTSLTNSAMPLLRYDTEDSAVLADNDCVCGRSLMSFVDVEGRYRRLAQLPEGSYQRFKAIQAVVNGFARESSSSIQQYQVYQCKNGQFTLILDCESTVVDKLSPGVIEAFEQAWPNSDDVDLVVVRGRDFHGLEKRKFQIFYSEWMPD